VSIPPAISATPLTRLEVAVAEARGGRLSVAEMMGVLIASDVVLLSAAPARADGTGVRPILFGSDGEPMVACFTALERIGGLEHLAVHALHCSGRAILRDLRADHGLAINPGQPIGFAISAAGRARVVADLL
jgi:hypothetical protein